MTERVSRFRAAGAALGVSACGTLALLAAPAPAAPPTLPLDPPNPLIRPLGFAGSPIDARAPSPIPAKSIVSRARLHRCQQVPDGLCGRVRVPLDRAQPSRRKISIFFEYFPARRPSAAREAIIVTEGGPGFSVSQDPFIGPFYRDLFDPLMGRRDLILLDQRGVGRSGAIRCPGVQHGSSHIYRDVRACGKKLGRRSSLYGSADVALDIEAVRKALHVRKLDMYGGSYAAQDVQAYTVRFPHQVRAAVLDSPFTSVGFNDLDLATPPTSVRTVRLICRRSQTCANEKRNPFRILGWLARLLRRHPIKGVGYDADGHRHRLRVTEATIPWHLIGSDAGAWVAPSEIEAAAAALRQGDEAPLLRLAAEQEGPLFGDEGGARNFSDGDGFARFCTDNPMPWDKSAPIGKRLRQWRAARAALPRDSYSPFSVDAWLAPFPAGPIAPDACIEWPAPRRGVAPPVPRGAKFPASVPALLLAGDLEANSADARRLRRAWPKSRFVLIANSGHHTALNTRGECSAPIIIDFIAKLKPGDTSCARKTHTLSIPAVGRFPRTAAEARPADVDPGHGDQSTVSDRKVVTAATAVITDVIRRNVLQTEGTPGRGLRGGTFTPSFDDFGGSNKLVGVRFARDVSVSGEDDYSFVTQSIEADVTVNGPGAEDGPLHVEGVWFGFGVPNTVLRISATLGGRQLALTVPAR